MTCSHVRFVGGGRWATIVLTELVQNFPCLKIDWVCNSNINKKIEFIKKSSLFDNINVIDNKDIDCTSFLNEIDCVDSGCTWNMTPEYDYCDDYVYSTTTTTTTGEDESTTGGDISPVIISFGSISDTSIEILIDTPYDIGGFQFDITGVVLSSAYDGLASDAGFTVSVGESTVIGFSFSGDVISAGSNGLLTNLSYTAIALEFCLDNLVLSDPVGNAINHELGDCIEY